MANEDRRKLFNAISKAGYDIGNYDDFDRRMNNAEDRQKFFTAVNKAGCDIGDQAEFERRISPSKYKLNVGGNEVPVSESEYMDFMKRNPSGTSKKPTTSNSRNKLAETNPSAKVPMQFDLQQAQQMASGKGPVSWEEPQEPKKESLTDKVKRLFSGGATLEETKRIQKNVGQRMDEAAYEQETGQRLRQPVLNPEFEAPTVDRDDYGNIRRDENGDIIQGFTTDEGAAKTHQQIVGDQEYYDSLSDEEKREWKKRINEDIEQLDYKQPTLFESLYKGVGAGVMKAGIGLLNAMSQLTSGMIVEDPSSPTGYRQLKDYDPNDTETGVGRGLTTANEYAESVSRQAQPNNGEGFVDMLLNGDIKGVVQKGLATAGESLPMTLSWANPYTATLNAISMAGNNFREQTLENPDIPTWKRAGMAIGSAAIEQAVEKYADPFFKYTGGLRFFKKAGKEATEEVVKNVTEKATETLAKRIMHRLGGLAKDAAGEGAEEIFSNVGNDILGEALDLLDGDKDYGIRAQWEQLKKQNPNADLSDFAYQKAKENIESFIGGALAGFYTSGTTQVSAKALEYSVGKMVSQEEIAQNPGAQIDPMTMEVASSYDDGYNNSQDPSLRKQLNDEAAAAAEVLPNYGDEFAKMVTESENPVETLDYLMNNRDYFTDEQIEIAADYFQKKAAADGMMDGILDQIDTQVEEAKADVVSNTHQQTGSVITAQYDGKEYYVVGGDVVIDPITGTPMLAGTGGAVVVKDAETGETSVMNPNDLTMGTMQSADELIQGIETDYRQQLEQQAEDDITYGAPANEVYQMEDTVTLMDGQGGVIEGQIGMMPNSVDGVYVVYTTDGKALQMTADDMNRRIVAHNGAEVQRESPQQIENGTNSQLSGENLTENAENGQNYAQNQPENIQNSGNEDIKSFVEAARNGDKEAQDKLNSYGVKWEKKPVVRFVAKGEVDNILNGGRYEGRFGNGRVDVTNSTDVTTAATSDYRITFKDDLDWATNDRLRMKNEDLGDGYIMDGYSLDDVATIEKRNDDGTYSIVYEASKPQEQQQSALSRIPVKVDEKGNPFTNKKGKPVLDWHKASVEDAAAALIETTGGNMLMARDTANDLYKQGQQKLEKIRKQQPKGDDPIEMAESRMEIQRQVEEQQAINKQWQDVNQLIQRQMREEQQRIEEERKAALTAEQRAAEEAEKARIEEQRRQIDEERRRKKMEEEMANWNKPYAPLAKARKEMAGDPDAAAILNDVEPRSLEEWVSSLLTPKSMMWDDEEIGGRTVAGLQSELGLQKKDVERVGSLVAPSSKGGKPFGQVVHDIWEGLPEGMKNMYNDQDVRNTLIDMFNNIGNALDMRHLAEINRIQEARDMMAENQRRYEEAELEAWAEAMHLTPEERETYNEWMEQAPTEPEAEIINNIIADEQYRIDQREGRQPASRADVSGSTSSQETVQQAAETADNGNNEERIAQEGQAAQSEQVAADNNVSGAESESVIPKPEVDEPRFKELRQNLVDAYTQLVTDEANYPDAAKKVSKAARQIQRYVDEGLDDYKEYEMGIEDYEGNDPEKLADQYITRVFQDRYADDDPDDLYIYHGLKPEMRKEFKFLEHNGKQFEANEHGICLNPNVIKMHKDKDVLTGWEISTALSERGWVGAPSAHYSTGGWSSGVSASWYDEFFATEEECQAYWAQRILDFFKKSDAKKDKKMAKYFPSLQELINKVGTGNEFKWGQHGEILNPHVIEFKKGKFSYRIETAEFNEKWLGALWTKNDPKYSDGGTIHNSDTHFFDSEQQAQAYYAQLIAERFRERETNLKGDLAKVLKSLDDIINKEPGLSNSQEWDDGASYTAPNGKKFLFNKDGVCTNPNPSQVGGTTFDVTMATAYNGTGWSGSVIVDRSLNFAPYKDVNKADTPVFHTEEECRAYLAGKAIDELKESWEGKQETLLIKALRKMQRQRADETEEEEEPVVVSQVNVEGLFNDLYTKGKTKLSDHSTPVKPKAKKRQPKNEDFSGLNVGVRFNTPDGVIEIARVDYDRLLVKDVDKDGNTSSQTREIDTVDLADGIKAGTITKVKPAAEQPKAEHKRLVSDDRMEELKKQLKAKLGGQLNVGVDPEVLSLGAQLAVGYLERGVTKFADFAKAMIDEVGDFMRPYLKSFYNAVRDMPEAADYAADMDDYQTVSAFDVHNFDKGGKVPDAITKAQQVTNEQKVKKNVKKIKEKQPNLFAGDLFADQFAEPVATTPKVTTKKVEDVLPAISSNISQAEVEKAMKSNLVQSWLKGKGKDQAFNLFGIGIDLIRMMARARLGITNKYQIGSMFNNAVEIIEAHLDSASKKGLDDAIAKKYDFHDGDLIQKLIEDSTPLYTDEELSEIGKFLTPAGMKQFKEALQAFGEEKQIREEMERLKTYDNGNAVAKAFAMYDIATRRLREQYDGDERFFSTSTRVVSEDPTRNNVNITNNPDFKLKDGETTKTEKVMKSDVARQIAELIATAPISVEGQAQLGHTSSAEEIAAEEAKVDTNPTEAQKEAGNYQKGHIWVDGHDITIENPKGSIRRGTDANGKEWKTKMNNTYGYIRGTEGVDGDHIDVFLSDNPAWGGVYVVDQVNPDGSFDEHKVMYGFPNEEEARKAYLSNYSKGWKGLGTITEISREDFKKWIDSSHRKTKPFADYQIEANPWILATRAEDGTLMRRAIDKDVDTNDVQYFYNGKPAHIMLVTRKGEQVSATKFSEPTVESVTLTDSKRVKLNDLWVKVNPIVELNKSYKDNHVKDGRVEFVNVRTNANTGEKQYIGRTWDLGSATRIEFAITEKDLQANLDNGLYVYEPKAEPKKPKLDKKDYKSYMTPEAREYFAKDPRFASWSHPELSFITAAIWDQVEIPGEVLQQLPEIVEAENKVKAARKGGKLTISDEERDKLANNLIESRPARQEHKAIIVVGLPAGGKSSVFANPLSEKFGARIIDSDDVKPLLPGYDNGNGADYVQDASSEVAERAVDLSAKNGDNILLPRIGGDSVYDLALMLRIMGYDVQLYFNDVKGVTSIDRAASRFAETGRYLSLDYLTKKAGVPSEKFCKFAEKSIGDYLNERTKEKVQNIQERLVGILGAESLAGERLRELYADVRGREAETDRDLQGMVGAGGLQDASNELVVKATDPLFTYAEWKSNDVPRGEKPREIWNSNSNKTLSDVLNNDNNELHGVQSEQGLSGEPAEASEEAGQTGGAADRAGAERSPEQHRVKRSGHEHTIKNNNTRNNVGERGKDYAPTSTKARFNANVEAIKLMRQLIDNGVDVPTKEQMAVLRQYSGWGGMGTYFNDATTAEYRELMDLLSEEELNDARLSINSAYYTPANVIDTLWDIAKEMGFKGGNVLEGSAGIGNIIGQMPTDMSRSSNIEAVEIDAISGNILKLLYPDAKVHIKGFQDVIIPNGSVDLAITNVPFVTGLQVFDKVDKDLSRKFRNIHDFCIAKNIRKLREGGIGLFITSSGTLDKSTELRAWIADEGQADVMGAFRMNNETFGGTTVTSDIIVVRKRTNGQKSPKAIDISTASPIRVGSYEDKYGDEHQTSMVVNDYFKIHPEMMAGEMAFAYEKGDTFRPGSYGLYPVKGMDQNKMLADFAKSMSSAKEIVAEPVEKKADPNQLTEVKEGRMLLDDNGRLCISRMGTAVPLQVNDQKIKGKYTKKECFEDYQSVQKAVDDVLQQQLNSPDDEALKPKLAALNKAYDNFVKKYGYLHKNTAIAFLRNDIDFPSFQALEQYNEKKDIKGNITVTTKKPPIFSERVLGFKSEPKPKNVKDAVTASIFRSNMIDLEWIAEKLDRDVDDVRKEILDSRLGFEDPSTGAIEIRYKYLSGNVREKLSIAEGYNTDGKYSANVEELRKAVPMDIPSHLIDFSLGSSWLPIELYNEFIKDTYDVPVTVKLIEGSWIMKENGYIRSEKNRAAGVYSEKFRETIYGHQLVNAALNNRPIRVTKQVKEGYGDHATTKTVNDQAATQACAVRVDEIKEEFRQWMKQKMQSDVELSKRIEKIYNDKFNALVPMQIDDEFLPEHFDGSNVNITLRPHQKRGAIRDLTSPTMLAHEVGTGKSFTLITTAMEMRRLGTAKKPMLIVQNATVAQMTADAKLLYPNAKVLTLTEKDRNAEGRRAFYASIKYNDWDLIIIPQSTFERIPDSPERELQFIQEKIDEKKHVIEAAEAAGADSRQLRQLKNELEKIEQEYGDKFLDSDPANDGGSTKKRKKKDAKREATSLDKAKTKAKEQLDRAVDDVQYFDDLGVDALLVDEAHEYKHLGFQTSIGRGIKGIDPSYSKKCAGLYNKTRCVYEKAGWKNVVFATGTPISNTAAEIWTFMKYLMPADVMKQNDIYYFDDFVRNFGNISQMLEFTTSGKFKENTRFAAYVNRPELMRIWMQVADIVRSIDAKDVQDKLPKKEGGKDQDVFLPQSPSLINIMAAVRAELERFENMEGKEKKENSHIPLTMYGVAKRAAIDPRLVNPDAADEPLSKTNAAVAEIIKDLKATKAYNGTIAVFCDNQNRKGEGGVVEFNIYDDIKQKLIKGGVPEKQIAIIKSGMTIKAKQAVFDAVNAGDIRVVLGSTQTLGTGVNMQERLHLLIHMDAPDRPMDYTQRNGRIERQGNLHKDWDKPIRIVRFGVEDSLDVTAYQRLKTKSGFIDSIMNGKSALANNQVDRTVEEEEEGMFDNPVAVLSGSQYALLKNKAERELRKYQGKKSQWEADQIYITNALRQYNSINEDAEQKAQNEEKDLANIKSLFPDGKVKTISVEGTNIDMTKGDEAVGQLSKVIKEKINDPVNAIVKRNRENPFHDDETLRYKIKLDGHDVDFTIAVTRSNEWDNAANKMRTVIHKFTSYNSPDLRIKSDVSARSVKDLLDDILDEVVTGVDYQDRIDAIRAAIERRNSEMAQMKEREGKPFEYDKELEAARKQVDEYTELMKKEMEEKEAKYASQQTGDVDLTKVEDSEDDNLYRMMDEYEEPIFYSNALRAVEEIRQEKATPEQWLAMIQKNGGLKAGEDKWLGLSDWLNNIDKKSVTKQELIDFIEQNQIEVEEVNYADEKSLMNNEMESRIPGWKEAFEIYPDYEEFEVGIKDGKKALDLFNANVEESDRHELIDGELGNEDYWDIKAWAEDMVSMTPFPKGVKRIEVARQKYSTKNIENKREIALTVPTITPYEAGDRIHFGDAGGGRAIAWIRFGDAAAYADNGAKEAEFNKIMADNDQFYKDHPQFAKYGIGSDELKKESEERKQRQRAAYAEVKEIPLDKKVLVIDEIQSNRHQDGRDKGYSPSAKERNKLKEDWYDSAKKRDKYFEELTDKYNVGTLTALRGKATAEELNKYQQLMDVADKKLMEYETANNTKLVPDAPFEKNWHELAMKRMLRYAAENGYDKIAWTTGQQQTQRYNIGHVIDRIGKSRTFEDSGETRYDLFPKDDSGSISLFVKDGIVTRSADEKLEGKRIEEVVGKELAARMSEMEDESYFDINEMTIGGEGMKGFYDEILPRFLNKYGKKWGVKVEKTRLPKLGYTGETMWSIDVTPEMRESVLQGQPMFREQDQFAEGQLFPIRTTTANSSFNVLGQRNTYSTELLPDEYTSLNTMLDTLRNQFPSYYVTIEDDKVKMQSWNTVLAEAKQAQTMKQTKGAENYVRRKTRQAIDAVNDMAKRMHLDVEVLTSTEGLTDKQKRAKGWFNPKTHKIMIVLENHTNRFDLINTLLHEGVAHYGLRQMFGKNFDTFLDNVYNNVDESIKEKIDAAMKKNGWSRHVATEEYLARLAERTDFENAQNSGWWQKIKDFFLEMLAKAGFSTYLSDNDLRYILWRSYDNLVHPDSRRNIFDKAKEVQMQSQLRVSQYAERYQPTGLAAERKISEPVEKEYSTIEEAEAIFDDLSRKYNSVPVAVVDKEMSDREIAEKIFGESVKDESDEVISNAMAYLYNAFENKSARYIPDLGKIIIFANATKTKRFEELFFHENLHAIQQEKYGDGVREVAESFWDNAPDEVNGVSKDWVKRKYQHEPEDWKEEFLTYALAKAMVSGDLSEIDRYADVDEFLEEIGYDRQREKEERERSLGEAESREAENKGGLLRRRDEIEDIISKAKADGTYMLAPNGKPTNLNEDQWTMVRTKAFKDWFGDWENDPENASKVVDENGEPKVMYHGTNLTENNGSVAFWKFRPDSHFGTDRQADSRLLVDTWLPALAESLSNKPRTLKRIKKYEVFLNIRNPKRVKDTPQEWIDENEGTFSEWWDKQNDRAKYQGYDGIVYLNEYEDREHPADSWITFKPNQVKSATDNNGDFSTDNDDIRYSMRTKSAPKKTGTGYKVFVLKDGKLYPPMVANPNGEGTPIGMWLDADAAPIAGTSKTGRPQVKAGGKGTQGGSGQLAYRPGWHLGTIPYALQFNRKDENGEKTLFPNNFVWAEVEYANDVDYNDEAYRAGVNENGKYQHSLAGLKHVPTDGSYMYRTNPNPETDPWIITGAMKVKKILSREEVDELVRQAGREPQKVQEGDVLDKQTLDELNAEIRMNEAADEMGLLYRSMSDNAQDIYNEEVAKKSLRFAEAWQDSMIGLKAIQDAIAAETGNVANGAEDAYHFENRMHGRAKNMTEQYDWRFYRPMLKLFADFCKNHNLTQNQGIEYLISKSGLERNVYYAFRNAMKQKVAEDINAEREKLEKDYAKGKIAEATYKQMKKDLEEKERTGVDDEMQKVKELLVYKRAKEDYEKGDIGFTEYLRRIEQVIGAHTGGYYGDYAHDYSGLTETFAKDMYDAAQEVKKEAQRTIDPKEKRTLWSEYDAMMRDAYTAARQVAEDAVFAAETDVNETNKLWNAINAATKETLKTSYESGMIDRKGYDKVRDMFDYYIPLRGWDEDKAADVYTYMGKDNVFSPAVKKTWGRTSKAENPLAYIGNIAVSTILSGHKNLLKQHFLNYVMNNPTNLVSISESWYENIGTDDNPIWILRSADTAGKSADEIAQIVNDFNDEMQQKQAAGLAMPVKGRLRLDVNATKGQKAEHVVEVQRAGHTYQLYINGDPKAAQALNGTNSRSVSRISDTYLGQQVTKLNRAMAMFFTSKNPAFVVSNLSRDLNMAGASVAINEGKKYNARFIANAAKVLTPRLAAGDFSRDGIKAVIGKGKGVTGMMPKLMAKWKSGKLDTSNETERYFKEFMDEGGETGFVNMLSVDSFKEKMKNEIKQMNGSTLLGSNVKETSVGKALRLLGETFEFYNRCAEDATRFIVYMTSRQMGKTLEESIADAKDVTLNFNRKGTGDKGNAEIRDLFIFVNPAIQALANMYRMSRQHPLKFGAVTTAFVAGGALMAILNTWALNLFGDDDDKEAYWNLPPWVRKNNLVMWVPGTKNFITIPLAQEFRVFYGIGEMIASASLDHPVHNPGLELASSVADLIPINPTGNGGNLMVDFAPTMIQPLMQVGENVDFTGKPIWKDNQGNKFAPAYTKAYVSTPRYMVKVAEALNTVTGGNEGKQGVVEQYSPIWGNYINNPAVWNHLLQGYFGGMYNTIAKGFDVIATTAQGEMPKVYQTPVINRFMNRPVERDNAGALGEEYYKLIEDRDRLKFELRTWRKKAADGEEGAQEHVDEILDSPEWKQVEVIDHYDKIMKDLRAGEKAATNSADKADIKESISMYKQQMNEELHAISEGKDPLDAAAEEFGSTRSFAERNKLRMRIERLTMDREGVSKNRTMSSEDEVAKALQYAEDEARESRDINEKYLQLASPQNMRDDARIKAARARLRTITEEVKRLQLAGRLEEAIKYQSQHANEINVASQLNSLSRTMNDNKKLLGKGYDSSIMKLIDSNRRTMLKTLERLQ